MAAHEATAAIFKFHRESLGVLVVGSPVGAIQKVAGGAHLQHFEFGSILKPLDGPPTYATRYIATIDIAAIKCFGTDDPGGTDEPYIVAAIYAVDPLDKVDSVQINEIHFGDIDEGSIFAQGRRLTQGEISIPGDGNIQVNLSLWDEEIASPSGLQDTWRETATAAILAGLTLLNPAVGAAAASLEAAKGVVTDASRDLITEVSDFLGIADDHIATREFPITADFLRRLIADGNNALTRRSGSIPGIPYNFPELPETGDPGRSWLFEGEGGSYRIFLSVRASEVNLTPPPHF
jgi:hypothetical protein